MAGLNVNAIAHQGAAYHSAQVLNLQDDVFKLIEREHKELTSPYPLVGGLGLTNKVTGAIDATVASSQNVGAGQNSGQGFSRA